MSLCVCVCVCMCADFATQQTIALQAPLSFSNPQNGIFRQEYWSGSPCPPPGDHLHPGMESMPLVSPALVGGFFTTSATWETHISL